ncbi:amiloride-sensitive sodium channel subunit beta-like [Watersipora subatra]|uniref:amiloride-sensitive sodium channel subunit beta-like n=1 Tax=Watersipora subatra TaxID=2589382 RepID=UPI00355C881F
MQDVEAQKPETIGRKLKTALIEFSETTSAHGPPKIVGHKKVLAKLFWALLFLTGIAVFTYFTHALALSYSLYQTTTDIEVKFAALEFPAVTVCNLNQIRKDRMPTYIETLTEEFEQTNLEDLYGGKDEWQLFWDSLNHTTVGFTGGAVTTDPSSIANTTSVDNTTTDVNKTMSSNTTSTANATATGNSTYSGNSTSTGNSSLTGNSTSTGNSTITLNNNTVSTNTTRKKRAITELESRRKDVLTKLNGFYVQPDTAEVANMSWFNNVGGTSSDKSIIVALTESLSNQSTSELYCKSFGHEIQEMLQECSFLGKKCGPRDFYWFYDKIYGNCYTYNSGMDGTVAKITSPGATFGLSLTLFINQEQYIPVLSPQAGVRIMLHPQGEVPIMEEDGFNVSPGVKSDIAVRYVEINRLDKPAYKNCRTATDNSYNEYYPGNYTLKGCIKTCTQRKIIEKCSCASPLYRSPETVRACALHEYWCVEEVEEETTASSACVQQCPKVCWESQFDYIISTSQWPSAAYKQLLAVLGAYVPISSPIACGAVAGALRRIWEHGFRCTRTSKQQTIVDSLSSRSEELKKALHHEKYGVHEQLVKIQIYYDNLNYYSYTERPMMLFQDLIGAIGGHLGLWIGMSVMSFFEVFELVATLMAVCLRVCKERNNRTGNYN